MTTTATDSIAFRVTITSVMLGMIYFGYITLNDFPPDILRIVPVIWFVGTLTGLMLGVRSMLVDDQRFYGVISILINIVNLPLSAIFMFAAAIGD